MAGKNSPRLVNVIASLDLKAKAGRIMYVNPGSGEDTDGDTKAGAAGRGPVPGGRPALGKVDIVVYDGKNVEIERVPADLHISSCKPGESPASAIINQDIPQVDAMRRLVLELDGKAIAEFVPATEPTPAPGVAVAPRSMGLGPPLSDKPHHRPLDLSGAEVKAAKGITYTVQISPDDSKRWHTIAVGVDTPAVDIDRHQFQGAKSLNVRVLRSTGFAETLFAESKLDVTK